MKYVADNQFLKLFPGPTKKRPDPYKLSLAILLDYNFTHFTFTWPYIVTNFFIIKPTRCTNFPNLLRHESVHVSGSSSAHHQEFIHCTLGTGMSYRFEDSFRAGPGSILVLLDGSHIRRC